MSNFPRDYACFFAENINKSDIFVEIYSLQTDLKTLSYKHFVRADEYSILREVIIAILQYTRYLWNNIEPRPRASK